MKIVDFIKEEDFAPLLPVIKRFADVTKTPYHQQVNEVALSLLADNYLTIVAKDDEKNSPYVAYLTGYWLNRDEFLMSQMYSEDPSITPMIGDLFERHLKEFNVKRIIALYQHIPRSAEKYGYKVTRHVLMKELT